MSNHNHAKTVQKCQLRGIRADYVKDLILEIIFFRQSLELHTDCFFYFKLEYGTGNGNNAFLYDKNDKTFMENEAIEQNT